MLVPSAPIGIGGHGNAMRPPIRPIASKQRPAMLSDHVSKHKERGLDKRNSSVLLGNNVLIAQNDMPSVNAAGMKNIEHYLEKSLIEGKYWYRCKWHSCTYSTIRSDSIVRHMRKHTGERPYKCWFCEYATIQSSALKIHMRRHTGEKPYTCKYPNCGKRFAVLNTLVVHERTHTGIKPYKCSYSNSCNYSSSDRSKLILHMRKVHRIEMDPNKVNQPPSQAPTQLANSSIFAFSGNVHDATNPFLALVNDAIPSHHPSTSMINLSGNAMQHNNQMLVNNIQHQHSASSSSQAKCPQAPGPVSLNIFTAVSSNEDYDIVQSSCSSQAPNASTSGPNFRSKHKARQPRGGGKNKAKMTAAMLLKQSIPQMVTREDNSIKRVMLLVDKRQINNRTLYFCKWPHCTYESSRSDSIVRHMRSHTGERPYKCNFANCSYATIQKSTLKKHLSKHLEGVPLLSRC